ncbi:MAG: hypothetical protein ACM31I_10465 [Deltaproteobacteria bacterium]
MRQEFYVSFEVPGRPMRRVGGKTSASEYLRPDNAVNPDAVPTGRWISTDREDGAYCFPTREAAETLMLLDAIEHPDRLGRYRVIAVTRVVEDGAVVTRRFPA